MFASDEEGPFQFNCNALEVTLSPRAREREVGNTAFDVTFEALVTEVLLMDFHLDMPYFINMFSVLL